jgi:hypothetical protein
MSRPALGSLLLLAALLATCFPAASSQGLPVQYGLLPLGDLTTNDQGGPYLVPAVQAAEVEGEWAGVEVRGASGIMHDLLTTHIFPPHGLLLQLPLPPRQEHPQALTQTQT